MTVPEVVDPWANAARRRDPAPGSEQLSAGWEAPPTHGWASGPDAPLSSSFGPGPVPPTGEGRPVRGRASYPYLRWGVGDVFYGLLVVLGASLVATVPFVIANLDQPDSLTTEGNLGLLVVGALATWAGFGGWPVLVTYWRGQKSLAADFRYSIRWVDLAFGLGGGVLALILGAFVAAAQRAAGIEQATNTQVLTENRGNGLAYAVIAAVVTIGAPLFEELFFRGLTYAALEKRFGSGVAIVGSTLLFGVLHFQGGPSGLAVVLLIVHITVFGLILGALRYLTNRCGAGVVAHMTINATATLLILFGVS